MISRAIAIAIAIAATSGAAVAQPRDHGIMGNQQGNNFGATLQCGEFQVGGGGGTITDLTLYRTGGFWIGRGTATSVWRTWPNNPQAAIGTVIPAGGPYYLCPDRPFAGAGDSSIHMTINW